jgi:predicted RNase H-like HicB family nuclease
MSRERGQSPRATRKQNETSKVQEVPVETAQEKTGRGQLTIRGSGPTRSFDFEFSRDEKGWLVGRIPALPGCHTQARTETELMERLREALELALEDSDAPPTNLPSAH